MIADIASGRPALPFEKMLYRAAARDRRVARSFSAIGSRSRSPAMMLRPDRLARIVAAGRGA